MFRNEGAREAIRRLRLVVKQAFNQVPYSSTPVDLFKGMRVASLSTYLTLPFVVQNSACSACLLPLLYQTPTLLSSKPKTASSFPALNRHVSHHNRHSRNLPTATQRQAGAETARRGDPIAFVESNGQRSSDAPLDTEPRKKKSPSRPFSSIEPQREEKLPFLQKNKQQRQPVRPSTMTAAEQTVFGRLIKEVSGPKTPEEDGEDEPISGYDPAIDLDGIFEDAITRLRLEKESLARSAAKNLSNPNPLRRRAVDVESSESTSTALFKRPLGPALELGDKALTGNERERLEKECDVHRTLVLRQLDWANSDEEIWQVLQEQVFSLVIRLNDDVEETESPNETGAKENRKAWKGRRAKAEEKRAKAEEKKRAKAEEKQARAAGKTIADVSADGKNVADVSAEQREPYVKENPSANLGTTKAIPIDDLVKILHQNYAEYCLHTLRLFRRKHPSSSYALRVLATMKDLGPISYVLGVSTDLYNEVLFLQWTQYSDLHGMADTMAEMFNQGIEGNDVTVALFKGIVRQRRRGGQLWEGPVIKEWWNMRGNVEGWRRVKDGYGKIIEKHAERAAALGEEV